MRLDITEILQEPGRTTDYQVNEPPMVDEDIECLRPIEGRISFNNTGGTLIITGDVGTHLALACSRCAEYFEHPIALKLEEAFELQSTSSPRGVTTPKVIEEDENPDAGKLFDGAIFDLSELIRQSIMVEQPTQPLPADTSDGRCAHCLRRPEEMLQGFGVEASEATAPLNPAFAKLGKLLNTDTEEKPN